MRLGLIWLVRVLKVLGLPLRVLSWLYRALCGFSVSVAMNVSDLFYRFIVYFLGDFKFLLFYTFAFFVFA